MNTGVRTKPRCDDYTANSGLSAREISPTAKLGLVVRYPKGLSICHTLAAGKDPYIWGCALSGDLTDYRTDKQHSQNRVHGPSAEASHSRRSNQCQHKTNSPGVTEIDTAQIQPVCIAKGAFVTNAGV